MTTVVEDLCRDYFRSEPLVVGPGVKTGMPILYDNPKEVGADRIVNAVAAYERYRDACIVVDFGTATTFDCVSAKGEYLGGVITPGLGISLDALVTRTAKLPRVELVRPPKVVGKNTVHAIQAGIVYGYASLVDGLVARIRDEIGANARVIATGGFADHAGARIHHDRDLRRVLDPGGAPAHSSSQPVAAARRIAWLPKRSHGSATSASLVRAASGRRCSPTP